MPNRPSEHYHLTIPATAEAVLVARMTLSAVGALCGLDIDLIGDIRTVTSECCDCLLHQGCTVKTLDVSADTSDKTLSIHFVSNRGEGACDKPDLSLDVTRGILETLMPHVEILSDERGVYGFDLALEL